MPKPKSETQKACEKTRREIRRQLTLRGVPEDTHRDVPSWRVDADSSRGAWGFFEPTGIIRVKVSHRFRTKQFVSNRQGQFGNLSLIVEFIEKLYLAQKAHHEEDDRQEARQRELEPIAERIRDEFTIKEYSGPFQVSATGQGLKLEVTTFADPDQIRLLLTRAKELGMMSPEEREESKSPTIFDRILEDV